MNGIFEKIGVNITKENKKNIEKIIHNIVGIEYKNYSETGKKIKKRIIENEDSFIYTLNSELGKITGILLENEK